MTKVKKLITLILMLLCIASLSSCSNSKPELLNYYDKQNVRVRLSNEKEATYKEVEEDISYYFGNHGQDHHHHRHHSQHHCQKDW